MMDQKIQNCIDLSNACAAACTYCAGACLKETDVKMLAKCINLDLQCAAICNAAVTLMSLDSDYAKELCRVCAKVCNDCAQECEEHAKMGMEHCRMCAEACRKCTEACEGMANAA